MGSFEEILHESFPWRPNENRPLKSQRLHANIFLRMISITPGLAEYKGVDAQPFWRQRNLKKFKAIISDNMVLTDSVNYNDELKWRIDLVCDLPNRHRSLHKTRGSSLYKLTDNVNNAPLTKYWIIKWSAVKGVTLRVTPEKNKYSFETSTSILMIKKTLRAPVLRERITINRRDDFWGLPRGARMPRSFTLNC